MRRARRYLMEGQTLAVDAIKRKYPAFTVATIRAACEAGVTTLEGLRAFDRAERAKRPVWKPGPENQVLITPTDRARHRAAPRER